MKIESNENNSGKPTMMRFGKNLAEMDKSFDIEFWQRQGDRAIFQAAWELVEFYLRDRKIYESRLQRTVENFQRTRG
ncbi:MAG: hypothetical protein M3033_12240 [Acidobacteriota bacterium]|nr:hypothetical protein [Acidobacteriota bacterium]